MSANIQKIFLSSTAEDLREHRQEIYKAITTDQRFKCIRFEDFGARSQSTVEVCRREVRHCDVVICLVGTRRGWEPEGSRDCRSITEMEFDWAKEFNLERLCFLASSDMQVRADIRDADALHARQLIFRDRVKGCGSPVVQNCDFDKPEAIATQVYRQLCFLFADREQASVDAAALDDAFRYLRLEEIDRVAANPTSFATPGVKEAIEKGRKRIHNNAEEHRKVGVELRYADVPQAIVAFKQSLDLVGDSAETWVLLGQLQYWSGRNDVAKRAFETAIEQSKAKCDLVNQLRATLGLAWVEPSPAASLVFADEALALAKLAQWPEGEARANITKAALALEESRDAEAELLLDKARDYYGATDQPLELGLIASNRANLHLRKGCNDAALAEAESAVTFCARVGLAAKSREQANLARVLEQLERPKEAERHYREALPLLERQGLAPAYCRATVNLALLMVRTAVTPVPAETLEEAEHLVEKCISLAEELGLSGAASNAHLVTDVILRLREESEETTLRRLAVLEKALAWARRADMTANIIEIEQSLAVLRNEQRKGLRPPPIVQRHYLHEVVVPKPLRLLRKHARVTEALVDRELEKLRTRFSTWQPTNQPIKTGDYFWLDGSILVHGSDGAKQILWGRELRRIVFALGDSRLPVEIESKLVGLTRGSELETRLPCPFILNGSEHTGLFGEAKLTVAEVVEISPSDDGKIFQALGISSEAELRRRIRDALQRDIENGSKQRLKRDLLDLLDKHNDFEPPPDLVEAELTALWHADLVDAHYRGLPPPDKNPTSANRRVRLGLAMTLLRSAAAYDEFHVTKGDVQSEIDRLVAEAPDDRKAETRAHYELPENRPAVLGPLVEDKVVDWLFSKASIGDEDIAPEELLKELE